tara:strand:+ start:200 stop:580 length:381 start_codon:yes stop_codon:yes gene_type:complete
VDKCRLAEQFEKRLSFIEEINSKQPGSYPEFPIDISKKESQQLCRDLALRGVEEMFEALQHLKNWKPHRVTDVKEKFNSDEFLEEVVDALNYFYSMLIVIGVNENDLHEAYLKKDSKIRERLKNGY